MNVSGDKCRGGGGKYTSAVLSEAALCAHINTNAGFIVRKCAKSISFIQKVYMYVIILRLQLVIIFIINIFFLL